MQPTLPAHARCNCALHALHSKGGHADVMKYCQEVCRSMVLCIAMPLARVCSFKCVWRQLLTGFSLANGWLAARSAAHCQMGAA
eukprot:1149439-Pelagomonas_calceolata.AAC.1